MLVHAVSKRAWPKILLDKLSLRFSNEEALYAANDDEFVVVVGIIDARYAYDDDWAEIPTLPSEGEFHFECEIWNGRGLRISPHADTNWRLESFFLSHTSNYQPSPEFLDARRRILMMHDKKFTKCSAMCGDPGCH